jgi:hypothetical protein
MRSPAVDSMLRKASGLLALLLVCGIRQATPWGKGNWDSGRTIIFHLPLSSIREFPFQVSPYEWVEFKNISLHPARKTAVTVGPYAASPWQGK